jgi:uncharacterized membrane protein HdeD (DUF308 family)
VQSESISQQPEMSAIRSGVIGIVFAIILIANYAVPGMGLAMLWTAALWAFIGGFFVIYRAFQKRKA